MNSSLFAASLAAVAATLGFCAGSASLQQQPRMATKVEAIGGPRLDDPTAQPVAGEPVGWVNLVSSADGESMPQQVPILAATAANEAWLQEQPAAIPAYVKAQWERRGYLVEESRRLVGLDLEDGRHVAVPVEELALDYVGRQPL